VSRVLQAIVQWLQREAGVAPLQRQFDQHIGKGRILGSSEPCT
jgi:hypothetical protein